MAKIAATKLVNQAAVIDSRRESDTIKVWESHRDQAILWRAIALLQIPATFMALIFALVMWNGRKIMLNVPQKPLPGLYAAQEIPDAEFIDVATQFLNLVGTYQHQVARRQFIEAAKMLQEPFLSKFLTEVVDIELKTIESTHRIQMFLVDPEEIEIDRSVPRQITVTMVGDRMKIVAGKEMAPAKTKFVITMTTVPHNKLNQYGITITDFNFVKIKG